METLPTGGANFKDDQRKVLPEQGQETVIEGFTGERKGNSPSSALPVM